MIIKNQILIWKERDFFSKLKNKCLNDEEIEQAKEIIKQFNVKMEKNKHNYFYTVMLYYLYVLLKNI